MSKSLSASQAQFDKLKADASKIADQKLNDLVSALQTKLDSIKGSLAKLKDSDQGTMKTIQSEVNAALAEVKKLYDQAVARLAEVKTSGG